MDVSVISNNIYGPVTEAILETMITSLFNSQCDLWKNRDWFTKILLRVNCVTINLQTLALVFSLTIKGKSHGPFG